MPATTTPNPAGTSAHRLVISFKKLLAVILALTGIALILWLDNWFMNHVDMPDLNQHMSYGLLLLVGFLTSFHCVGMCGPLIVGYTASEASAGVFHRWTHLQYAAGKTLAYSLIGALLGAFGSVIAFTPQTQGLVGVAAGVFLLLFGLHMLNAFSALSHFQLKPPAFVMRLLGQQYRQHHSPVVIGMLNGLMIICGPLQAMYVMAAGSGDWAEGGRIMLFFGLGTLPMLMGFGFLTSLASANVTPRLLKASGVIVIILGAIMLNRGMALAGSGWDFNTLIARASTALAPSAATTPSCESEQTIRMEIQSGQFFPNQFVIKKGIPVKWIIEGKELNACNKSLVVPDYDLKFDVHTGLQTIEFTPRETGVVAWSCWMGMMPGSFIVVEDAGTGPPSKPSFSRRVQDYLESKIGDFKALERNTIEAFRRWRETIGSG